MPEITVDATSFGIVQERFNFVLFPNLTELLEIVIQGKVEGITGVG